MNRIYKSKWNSGTQTWVACSELVKRAGRQSTSSLKKTASTILSFTATAALLSLPSPDVMAACDIPSNTAPSGSTITCTGTATGQYIINNTDVTLINQGVLESAGSLHGIVIVQPTTASGVKIVNEGAVNWTNAKYGGTGTGTRGGLNAGYYVNNNYLSPINLINEETGQINVDIAAGLSSNRYIAGIGFGAKNTDANIINKGVITVTSAAALSRSGAVGITGGGKNLIIDNRGTVSVTALEGNQAIGIEAFGAWSNGTVSINNSGTITVSGKAAANTFGMVAGTSKLTTSAQVVNSGTVELEGGTDLSEHRSAIYFDASNVSIPLIFENALTGVVMADDFSYVVALDSDDSNTSAVHITNSGELRGINGVLTRAGGDLFIQDAGNTTGKVHLGAGDNIFSLTGGIVIGDVTTLGGSDNFLIDGGDITGNVDTGAGDDKLAMNAGACYRWCYLYG